VKKELVEGQKATKRKLEEAGWTDTGTKFADLSIFKKKENEKIILSFPFYKIKNRKISGLVRNSFSLQSRN